MVRNAQADPVIIARVCIMRARRTRNERARRELLRTAERHLHEAQAQAREHRFHRRRREAIEQAMVELSALLVAFVLDERKLR
jgi:hypothetical protein